MINVDFILRTKQKIIINFEKKIIIFLFIKLFFSKFLLSLKCRRH